MVTSLKKAHNDFVERLKEQNKSTATITAYSKDIEQLVDYLTKMGVISGYTIESEHLHNYTKALAEAGLVAKSVSRKINSIKTFFRFMEAEGHIIANAANTLKHPELKAKAPRILSKPEYIALREVSRNDLRSHAIVEILLNTGIRISELALIKIAELNLTKPATLYIPKRESQRERVVPLTNSIVEAVNQYLKESAQLVNTERVYLFITKTGSPLLIRNIRSTLDSLFRKAGIKNVKVNDLRHTFVAHHLMRGVSIETVSKIAGHKRVSSTEKYLAYIEIETTQKTQQLSEL